MNHQEMIETLVKSPNCKSLNSNAGLIELALQRNEGQLSDRGSFSVKTGTHTGRSPKDRYLVDDPSISAAIEWGTINQPMSSTDFDLLFYATIKALGSKETFMMSGSACADNKHAIGVKVIADLAWHNNKHCARSHQKSGDNLRHFLRGRDQESCFQLP